MTDTNERMPRSMAQPREYRGVIIFPAERNSSGIRWTARMDKGYALRSDTLEGIKELIRKEVQHAS